MLLLKVGLDFISHHVAQIFRGKLRKGNFLHDGPDQLEMPGKDKAQA